MLNYCLSIYTFLLQALLTEEALNDDSKKFNTAVKALTEKDYDYLDFRNMAYDRDYGDFLNRMDDLTSRLQTKLEAAYDSIWDTPHAFQYLDRFERLSQILPIGGMSNKYSRMIINFKKEMERILHTFKRQTASPPVIRNYPSASGKIYWVRSLVYHLETTIDKFEVKDNLKRMPEYRKLVKQYNDTGTVLMQYELKIQEAWHRHNPSIRHIEDKIALPILRESKQGELQVNFDESFYALLKESEKLMKLDIPMPSVNQFLVKRKNWFYEYKSMVDMMLANHAMALQSVAPEWKRLFAPFLTNIRATLEPGLSKMNWYNHDWEEFTLSCTEKISHFQDLINRANDIYTNRIHMILDSMDRVELYKLPKKEAWTFQHFLDTVRERCRQGTNILDQKSKMVEEAVEDTIKLAMEALTKSQEGEGGLTRQGSRASDLLTVQDREQAGVMAKITMDIRKNYSKKILEKLEVLTRNALKHLTKFFSSSLVERSCRPLYEFEELEGTEYSFILTTVLSIPNIELTPTIEQIQSTLVSAGNLIMSVSKGVGQWTKVLPKKKLVKKSSVVEEQIKTKPKLYNPVKKAKATIVEKPNNFYGAVAENKEVTKAMAQLSSSMAGMKVTKRTKQTLL